MNEGSKATVWLVVGLGCIGVGVLLALPVSVEGAIALIVVGVVITMISSIERTIGTRGTEAELAQLDDKNRRLVEMIQSRRDRVWEGIGDQRYMKHEDRQAAGPDIGAVFGEIEDIFREVAALYHPDSDDAVFEARIGDIALAARSAVVDLLELAHQVPYVDPANWSLRTVLIRRDQIRKARKVYSTLSPFYRTLSRYQYVLRGAMIATRLALGANPILLAAWYVAGEVATRVGGPVLRSYVEARLKDPLERLVALVYLQAARTYDPRLAYRSADWAALVETLKIQARIAGIDHNRKLLLDHVLRARMLDDLAKMALLRALAADREPDSRLIPPIDFALLLPEERQDIAERLRDVLSELEGLNAPRALEAIRDLQRRLGYTLGFDEVRCESSGREYEERADKGLMRGLIPAAKAFLRRGCRPGRRSLRHSSPRTGSRSRGRPA